MQYVPLRFAHYQKLMSGHVDASQIENLKRRVGSCHICVSKHTLDKVWEEKPGSTKAETKAMQDCGRRYGILGRYEKLRGKRLPRGMTEVRDMAKDQEYYYNKEA